VQCQKETRPSYAKVLTGIAAIATLECNGERHIRLLLPLAFASPPLIEALANGAATSGIGITNLAQYLPNSWANQQRLIAV
jgi:hypothetical protein